MPKQRKNLLAWTLWIVQLCAPGTRPLAATAALVLLAPPSSAQEPDAPDAAAPKAPAAAAAPLSVLIEGVEQAELRKNIEAYLQIWQLTQDERPLPGEARLRWLHNRAEDDIRLALQPFGYYQPAIDGTLDREPDGWRAIYQIAVGPPLPIAAIDVELSGEGQADPLFQRIVDASELRVGATLNHARYEALKQKLQSLATERGYFDATLKQNLVRVDIDAYEATISLHYDTGKRYRFGDPVFSGGALAPEFLRRFIDFVAGDPYEAATLLKLQSDLLNSDYFDQVIVEAPFDQATDQRIPVMVQMDMKKARKYSFGLGYGTDTGVRGRGGLEQRRVNRWGHRYEAQLLASQVQYSVAGEYIIPGEDPRTDSFNLRTKLTVEDSAVKDSATASFGVSQQRQDGAWLKIASLDYQWERFTFGDTTETTRLLIGGLNWTRVDADPDRLNVSDGSRLGFELRAGASFLLSDITFVQAAVRGKWIKSLSEKQRFILRADAGTTYIRDVDFDRLPSSLRFFAGGDSSVRGYSLDSIGPRNADDDVIGGKHLLSGSVEYEYRIHDNWSVATFVDVGDAFDDRPDFKIGVGAGVRWRSPVGPVRVDIASGLRDPGDTVRLHMTIGPDL